MPLRDHVRRLALKVPQLGRLFDANVRLKTEVSELSGKVSTLSEVETERDRLAAELLKANDEIDLLKLQLYTVRSDFQRAVSRNDQLRTTLQDVQQGAGTAKTGTNSNSQLLAKLDSIISELDNLRRQASAEANVPPQTSND